MAVALGVLVPAVVVLGVKATREPPPAPPAETVDVVVAAAELPAGTVFSQGNLEQLTAVKAVPVAALPEGMTLVTSRAELVGKRLIRTMHSGEWIAATDIKDKPKVQLLFKPGYDLMSLPLAPGVEQAGVGPGSRIDVVARYAIGNERSEFTLVPDVVVLCVDCVNRGLVRDDPYPRLATFPVDQKQAALAVLAHRLNCELTFVLRQPGAPALAWDYDATLALLKGLAKEATSSEREVAPFPRVVP